MNLIRSRVPSGSPGSTSCAVVRETHQVLAEVGLRTAVATLSDAQRHRWQSLRQSQDRHDFLAARVSARQLVGAHVGGSFYAGPIEQRCDRCEGPHGRPTLPEEPLVHLSWSHARGIVAVAVSAQPVGIDVERVAATPPPGPAGPACTEREQWLAWTRMEALIKLGLADLDTATTWDLTWPESPRGRFFVQPDATSADGPPTAWVADLVTDETDLAVSVAHFICP